MTPELRRFMTPDLQRFATSRLRRFMIPDLQRFTISRLRRFMIPGLHRFNHPEPDSIFTRRSLIQLSFSNHHLKTYFTNFGKPDVSRVAGFS
jgi:hypothetical protein